jgi:WS/DGAT/MGAT family acyltransferase
MRMSETEAVMWAVEKDPTLRSDFCNLTFLEHAPPRKRLQAKLATALEVMPRLGQRVVSAPLRIVPPEWVDDPDLDLDYHVRTVGVPEPGDERALLDLVASIADSPFDRSRPLWEFTIIHGLADGRAALLQKVHHTITDGVGGLRLSLSLVDFERDADLGDHATTGADGTTDVDPMPNEGADRHSPLDVLRGAVSDATARNTAIATQALSRAGHVATHPQELPGKVFGAARFAGSVRRQLLVADRARSDVIDGRSLRRTYELFSLSLPQTKQAAKSLGGTVNDVFVAGIAGALRRYHVRRGSDRTELRMAMPVNLREHGDTAANRFTPVRLLIPLVPDDPVERFAIVHDRLATARADSALGVIDALAGLASTIPTSLLVGIARNQVRTVDFTASNLRGSPVPLYIGGARILGNFPFGPRTGSAFNATVLSYCDDLHMGINLDPAAIGDVDTFLDDLDSAYQELFDLANA